MTARMTPDELAPACAEVMWAEDLASQGLGMTLDAVAAGAATLSMTIRDDMVNGHGIAHGGFIFALADSAFAFACNSTTSAPWRRPATSCSRRPRRRGDLLVAVGDRAPPVRPQRDLRHPGDRHVRRTT